jgi:hypothetical protein
MHRQGVAGRQDRREQAEGRPGPEAAQAGSGEQTHAGEHGEAHEGRRHRDVDRHAAILEDESRQVRDRERRPVEARGDVVPEELLPVEPRRADVDRGHREAESERASEGRRPGPRIGVEASLDQDEEGEGGQQEQRREEVPGIAARRQQKDGEWCEEDPAR